MVSQYRHANRWNHCQIQFATQSLHSLSCPKCRHQMLPAGAAVGTLRIRYILFKLSITLTHTCVVRTLCDANGGRLSNTSKICHLYIYARTESHREREAFVLFVCVCSFTNYATSAPACARINNHIRQNNPTTSLCRFISGVSLRGGCCHKPGSSISRERSARCLLCKL